eukprot:SAG11_NODE_4041_length_2092_cov_2.353738_2_plen_65_part_00
MLDEAPSVHTVVGGAVLIAVLASHTLLAWRAETGGNELVVEAGAGAGSGEKGEEETEKEAKTSA